MNEITMPVFELFLIVDFILIAYSLYGINFDVKVNIDKIITSIIASPLSFILSRYIINGEVVETYADTNGYHFVPFQSLPIHYFLTGFAVLMVVLSVLFIVKFISDHFEDLEKKSAMGAWKENSFTKRR